MEIGNSRLAAIFLYPTYSFDRNDCCIYVRFFGPSTLQYFYFFWLLLLLSEPDAFVLFFQKNVMDFERGGSKRREKWEEGTRLSCRVFFSSHRSLHLSTQSIHTRLRNGDGKPAELVVDGREEEFSQVLLPLLPDSLVFGFRLQVSSQKVLWAPSSLF